MIGGGACWLAILTPESSFAEPAEDRLRALVRRSFQRRRKLAPPIRIDPFWISGDKKPGGVRTAGCRENLLVPRPRHHLVAVRRLAEVHGAAFKVLVVLIPNGGRIGRERFRHRPERSFRPGQPFRRPLDKLPVLEQVLRGAHPDRLV